LKAKKVILSGVITLVIALVMYYLQLPALNLKSPGFYAFLITLTVIFTLLNIISNRLLPNTATAKDIWQVLKTYLLIPVLIIALLLAVQLVGKLVGAPLFRASAYSRLLRPTESVFDEDIDQISFDQIPMLDSTSANNLANRKLGELSDLVSQFEVDGSSAQINYKNRPVRVTYLNYGDFFKWLNNRSDGIPAYMTVDMVTQEVSVTRLAEGIRYSPSEYFFRDLTRHLRFTYPTYMFGETNFEIDEEGDPYWVASVVAKKIGLFGGQDVKGAVLLNAVTGESTYYDVADVPKWVDRVYDSDMVVAQYDYYGKYHNGFINSLFGQKDVTVTTDGYNYIALDDDVWLYTGVTSVGGDESNIGFILVNQRTKESKYYNIPGAEEYSAMSSAQGAVQQYGYAATFPLLLNISGQPTYFMALKDSSDLVKQYAMVNVQQYQIVAIGPTVAACSENYLNSLLQYDVIDKSDAADAVTESQTYSGKITDLRSGVYDGSTRYYIALDNADFYYVVDITESEICAVLNTGDEITLTSSATEGTLRPAKEVTIHD